MKLLLVLLVVTATAEAQSTPPGKFGDQRWINSYDQILEFTCPSGQSISTIISQHDNKREDRQWDFMCQNTFNGRPTCEWIGYINDFDEEFTRSCPFGSVISGFYSYHENKHEDRRWKLYCCRQSSEMYSSCSWTQYVNDFDAYFRWSVPSGKYLVGVSSFHDNRKEDRRWKYQYCS